jgi:alpha-beta hydrolase superfamily lysophospholipase
VADSPGRRSTLRRVLIGVGIALGALVGVVLLLALIPTRSPSLPAQPDPAPDYASAVERFEAIRAAEEGVVFEKCRSRLLTHGEQTEVSVVLVHGLTNCPYQFAELGEMIHAQGANVLILRVPHHGVANADGTGVGSVSNAGKLTPQELRDYADEAVDIAAGLGRERRVAGLSMGGVITSWITQSRSDVNRTVVIAPAITMPGMPGIVDYMARNLFSRLPDIPIISLEEKPSDHVYQGEATRALASMYRMAQYVREQAAETPPAVRRIHVMTNANDNQVDNPDVDHLAGEWRDHGADVVQFEFPKADALPHDLIDPTKPDGDVAIVYPIVLEQLGFQAE